MRKVATTIGALVLGALLGLTTGCREQDGPEVAQPSLTDVVTFEGNNATGAVLTFNQVDDSPLITLQALSPVTDEKITPGTRILAAYRPLDGAGAYTSGTVELLGTGRINNGVLRQGKMDDYPLWDRDGVYVYSMWRTGKYINLNCRLTYDERPRTFMLMLDEETETAEVPSLYLVHTLADEANSHDRIIYASYDIGALWNRDYVKGVEIHVANTNLTDKRVFRFDKKTD